jgi:hypothetical protein
MQLNCSTSDQTGQKWATAFYQQAVHNTFNLTPSQAHIKINKLHLYQTFLLKFLCVYVCKEINIILFKSFFGAIRATWCNENTKVLHLTFAGCTNISSAWETEHLVLLGWFVGSSSSERQTFHDLNIVICLSDMSRSWKRGCLWFQML